jgi:hypothetical protein
MYGMSSHAWEVFPYTRVPPLALIVTEWVRFESFCLDLGPMFEDSDQHHNAHVVHAFSARRLSPGSALVLDFWGGTPDWTRLFR